MSNFEHLKEAKQASELAISTGGTNTAGCVLVLKVVRQISSQQRHTGQTQVKPETRVRTERASSVKQGRMLKHSTEARAEWKREEKEKKGKTKRGFS